MPVHDWTRIAFLQEGVHVLLVDLFRPTPRDPFGLHKAVWDEIEEEAFAFPGGKDRLLASCQAGRQRVASIGPVDLGDTIPEMPLLLSERLHIKTPLESAYLAAWEALPTVVRDAVSKGGA